MIGLLCFVLAVLASPFKSKIRLEAENAVLRHQLIVLRRKLRGRVQPANSDRWFFVQLYRWFPSILKVLTIIRPETLVRWHQAGFRSYWRWKSRSLGGRPQIDAREMIALVSASSSALETAEAVPPPIFQHCILDSDWKSHRARGIPTSQLLQANKCCSWVRILQVVDTTSLAHEMRERRVRL